MFRAATLILVLFARSVAAQSTTLPSPHPPAGAPTGPCVPEIAKHCKDVQPGGGRVIDCLRAHRDDLSPPCRARLDAMVPRGAPAPPTGARPLEAREVAACRDDLAKHCADVPHGAGRLRDCLAKHNADLTPGCKTALTPAPSVAPGAAPVPVPQPAPGTMPPAPEAKPRTPAAP